MATPETTAGRTMNSFPDTQLLIDGRWIAGSGGRTIDVLDPATGTVLGRVCVAEEEQLEMAARAAHRAFPGWRDAGVLERAGVLRRAAAALRGEAEQTARILTMEQGKPLAESRAETATAADVLDWFAEEARRTYGRVIPARDPFVRQTVLKEAIGPVAAFTPA